MEGINLELKATEWVEDCPELDTFRCLYVGSAPVIPACGDCKYGEMIYEAVRFDLPRGMKVVEETRRPIVAKIEITGRLGEMEFSQAAGVVRFKSRPPISTGR